VTTVRFRDCISTSRNLSAIDLSHQVIARRRSLLVNGSSRWALRSPGSRRGFSFSSPRITSRESPVTNRACDGDRQHDDSDHGASSSRKREAMRVSRT